MAKNLPACPQCGAKVTRARESDNTIYCVVCGYRGPRQEFIQKEEAK